MIDDIHKTKGRNTKISLQIDKNTNQIYFCIICTKYTVLSIRNANTYQLPMFHVVIHYTASINLPLHLYFCIRFKLKKKLKIISVKNI
jgi:hypothetical protein